MSQDCEKRIVESAKHLNKMPLNGQQFLMPMYVNCQDYLNILRGSGGNSSNKLIPYQMVISDDAKKREDTIIAKSLGLEQYLVSALRQAVTEGVGSGSPGQVQMDEALCQRFNLARQNNLSPVSSPRIERIQNQITTYKIQQQAISDKNSVYTILSNMRTADASPFDILSGRKRFTVQDNVLIKENPNIQQKQDEFDAILSLNEGATKVDVYLRNYAQKINKLQDEDRIFPVESFVTDENGNVVVDKNGNAETSVAFLILPEGLTVDDVSTQLTWDTSERKFKPEDLLNRVVNESMPLLSPLHPDEYGNAGITESDLLAYDKVSKTSEQYDDIFSTIAVISTSSHPDKLINEYISLTGLDQDQEQFLRAAVRLSRGTATAADVAFLTSDQTYFSETSAFRKLQKTLEEEKSKDTLYTIASKDIGKYLIYELTGIKVSTPTVGITPRLLAIESAINAIVVNVYYPRWQAEFESVKTVEEFNNSRFIRELNRATGEDYRITHKEFNDIKNVKELGGKQRKTLRRFINQQIKSKQQLANNHGHDVIKHNWHHRLGKIFGLIGVGAYSILSYFSFMGSIEAEPGSIEAESNAIDAAKYAALATLEAACMVGAFGASVASGIILPILLSYGIYLMSDYLKENNIEERDEQEKQARRIAAARAGLVGRAFESGIVITKNQVLQALSLTDSDPNDNVFIYRANRNNTETRVKTVSVPRTTLQTMGNVVGSTVPATARGVDLGSIEVSVEVPYIVEKAYAGSIFKDDFYTGSIDERRTAFETFVKNRCCGLVGPNLTPPQTDTVCIDAFRNIGQALKVEFALSGQNLDDKNLVAIAINYICNGNEPGCFTSGTQILMNNGNKKISDILVGDDVISFDSDGNLHNSKVINTFKYENREVSRYEFSNGFILESTKEHPIFTENKTFTEIGKIPIGGNVLLYSGETVSLVDKVEIGKSHVYNIEVDTHHTYIANGICVHNKTDPQAAANARRNLPPLANPVWENYVGVWPEPSGDVFSQSPVRWNRNTICEEKERLASPLRPGSKTWECWTDVSYGFSDDRGAMITDALDEGGTPIYTDFGIPKSPAFNFEDSAPPHIRLSEPSSPYFTLDQANLRSKLSGYPWFLSEPEIAIVESGNPESISQYFTENYPNDTSFAGHMVNLSMKYQDRKDKENRNNEERKTYIDCISEKILTS